VAGSVRRGLVAGAVGTTVLNAVTYLDMAVRGRPASELPARTVTAGLDLLDVDVPGRGAQRQSRETALGAIAGITAGIGVGLVSSVARAAGLRLSAVIGPLLTGAGAMAAADLPAAALGVTDLTAWSEEDWLSDVVPHLAYGLVTHQTLRVLEKRDATVATPRRPSSGLVLRSVVLGVASGCRSSLGLVAAAVSGTGDGGASKAARGAALVAMAAELAGDKHPAAPSRLGPPGVVPRFASGTIGSIALAGQQNAVADLPVIAGLAGVAAGAVGGAALREAAAARIGNWQAGLLEDAVAVALTWLAVRT
jgi:uncharacterized membrane protein